jgi:hypothetical protein
MKKIEREKIMSRFIEDPLYVVYRDGDVVYASQDISSCRAYVQQKRREDLEFVKEEYGVSEEDAPLTANCMAGYVGDAESYHIKVIYDENIDEDGNVMIDGTEYDITTLIDLAVTYYEE